MALRDLLLIPLLSLSACASGNKGAAYSKPKPKMKIEGVNVWVNLDTLAVKAILRLPALASQRGVSNIFPDKSGFQAGDSPVDTVRVDANHQWDSTLEAYGVEFRVARDRESNWVIIGSSEWVE